MRTAGPRTGAGELNVPEATGALPRPPLLGLRTFLSLQVFPECKCSTVGQARGGPAAVLLCGLTS